LIDALPYPVARFLFPATRFPVLPFNDLEHEGIAMNEHLRTQIRSTIRDRADELVELASALIRFPTLSPPGRNTAEIQGFIGQYLRESGFEIDRFDVYPGDPNVVGTRRGSDPESHASLIINGHVDVAEIGDPDAWSHPPFEPTVVEDRLYGRGAVDMKGPLAAGLFAARVLRDLGIDLRGDLIIESVIGEEQGEAGTLSCNERGYRADFAIVPEPMDMKICGQGGVITGWIEIQSPETLHDGVRARTIHAGGGLRGASAIEKMTRVVAALNDLERHWAVTKQYPGFPPGSTTINPAVIEGGRHPAFIADYCGLWITVHFYPDQTWQDVTAEIEDHVLRAAAADLWLRDNPPAFRWGGRSMIEDRGEIFPASAIPKDHPGTTLLAEIHQEITGQEPAFEMTPTVTDSGWLESAGIPTVIYGPGGLGQAHTIDERISIPDLITAAEIYAVMIAEWCNQPRPHTPEEPGKER
jgi:formylaminopyrimidine deformylase